MLASKIKVAFRLQLQRKKTQIFTRNTAFTAADSVYDKDPAPYFFNEEIQKLLQKLTCANPDKVFRRQLDGEKLEAPEYKFMTNEQLQKAQKKAESFMWERLQMPPIIKIRKENDHILAEDPALQGYDTSKYVFTDITFGVTNRDRVIAVREPNGTLRLGKWEEKDRLNQIYNPMEGREVYTPKMFEAEHLEPILERGDYEFILNRACIQFEPDNKKFHEVTQLTYNHIDKEMQYEKLRSTRHYGPMVFYLAWSKRIDNLLIENITMEKIEDAALVIKLYYILNSNDDFVEEADHIKLINNFIDNHAGNKQKLKNALRMYLELENERKLLKEDIEKAHGVVKDGDEESKN